jgi:hypothetical protein
VFLSSWMITAGIGAMLLLAAVSWRLGHRARMRGRIAAALHDEDPRRRRAGVLVATEQGLRANAALLAEHVERERHPAVLAALVEGVLRNAWEPTDHPAILALRLWAHEQRRPAADPERPGVASGRPVSPPAQRGPTASELIDPRADPVTVRLPVSRPQYFPAVTPVDGPRHARHRAGRN